jgi:hypothetical protein
MARKMDIQVCLAPSIRADANALDRVLSIYEKTLDRKPDSYTSFTKADDSEIVCHYLFKSLPNGEAEQFRDAINQEKGFYAKLVNSD